MKTIDNFRDKKYTFLMNSYVVDIEFEGQFYKTLEHAFQAAKTDDKDSRATIMLAASAKDAKIIGRGMKIRSNWDDERINVMRDLLRKKFEHPELQSKLIATKDFTLISGGDVFWGKVFGKGDNHLGQLLMELRKVIIEQNNEIFDDNCRQYLTSCGWSRDLSGDIFFNECWVPPFDYNCQYSLMDAVNKERGIGVSKFSNTVDDLIKKYDSIAATSYNTAYEANDI